MFSHVVTTTVVYSTSIAVATTKYGDTTVISYFTKYLSNMLPSWVRGGDVYCHTFVGFTCDGSMWITSINLIVNSLSGTLTPFLSSLSELEIMDLSVNKLTDAISSLVGDDFSHSSHAKWQWIYHTRIWFLPGIVHLNGHGNGLSPHGAMVHP